MSPSHTQLTAASDEEMPDLAPKPRTSRVRGFGLAVTVVGLVCMVGANWPRTKHVTMHHRLGQMRDVISRAVDNTMQNPSFVTSLDLMFGQDGGEEPVAMEISAKLQKDDDPPDNFTVEFTFFSEKGQGMALSKSLDRLAADMFGPETNHDIKVWGFEEKDQAAITFTAPQWAGHLAEELKEKDEEIKDHPDFTASIKFGSDLQSIFENQGQNMIEAWHGLHFISDTKFKSLIVEVLEGETKNENEREGEELLAGLKSLAGSLEIRYKNKDELGDLFGELPTMEDIFFNPIINGPPPNRREYDTWMNFKGQINGINTIEVRGLPSSLKLHVSFENFKPVKLLNAMMDKIPVPVN